MYKMTSRERFRRMFDHKEADRVPVIDAPWATTIARWRREGMPEDMHFTEYFDLDKVTTIVVDNSPGFEDKVIEETDEYQIYTTKWGATVKTWKHKTSTPDYLDFKVKTSDDWRKVRERMTPSKDRIPWDHLAENYKKWRDEGRWLQLIVPFGFDYTHSHFVGTENFLVALMDEPEWCVEMFNHFLDVGIALMDMIIDAGYTFDSMYWWDDMGYKQNTFFSLDLYRELIKPAHKRAIDWAHGRNMVAHLHSCGDIRRLVPDLAGIGLDGLNPLEVKAGMDPVALKKEFGKTLLLHGGNNLVLWDDAEAATAEIRRLLPILKESGGYIFSSDHSVPDSVSLENFRIITDLAKELGRY